MKETPQYFISELLETNINFHYKSSTLMASSKILLFLLVINLFPYLENSGGFVILGLSTSYQVKYMKPFIS